MNATVIYRPVISISEYILSWKWAVLLLAVAPGCAWLPNSTLTSTCPQGIKPEEAMFSKAESKRDRALPAQRSSDESTTAPTSRAHPTQQSHLISAEKSSQSQPDAANLPPPITVSTTAANPKITNLARSRDEACLASLSTDFRTNGKVAAAVRPDHGVKTIHWATPVESPLVRQACDSAANSKVGYAVPGPQPTIADLSGHDPKGNSVELLEKCRNPLRMESQKKAEACFHEAIAREEENWRIPLQVAVYALKFNKPQMAIEILVPARKKFPDSAAISRCLGAAHLQNGDYQASRICLEQAIAADKSDALSRFLMGCTLKRLGEFPAAQANFRQAAVLDPRYAVPD
jgi:hypothetical protein